MSKQQWRCLTCGEPMFRELSAQAAARWQRRAGQRDKQTVEICGPCGAYHIAEPSGELRRPTGAENLRIEFEIGDRIAAYRAVAPAISRTVGKDSVISPGQDGTINITS